MKIQQALAEANRSLDLSLRMEMRLGLHLGDMIVDGDDVYGDGVNVAARLESEAPPGGIVVSRSVHEAVEGRVKASFTDLGPRVLKNIDRPIGAFAVTWQKDDWPTATAAAPASINADPVLAVPDKPSIAVLPFTNMSGDPEQEYFADGMAEDILTGLSRFRWLFIIARNSSFTYKGRAIDVRQVGRELGVRYVLEGSVRRAGGRVRFTAQLIDTTTGGHVWADKYDGPVEDLFDLQDRITETVVGVLEPAIQQAEIERTRRKRPESMGAHDHYLRSLALAEAYTRESNQAMLEEAVRAIDLDPSFAQAYALAARAYVQSRLQGWTADEAKDHREVLDLVERGLRADRRDSTMLGTAGQCFAMFAHDLPKAMAFIDEAIAINPNQAISFLFSGMVRNRSGETRTAIEHLERARRLSPRDLRSYAIFQNLAAAHLIEGDPFTALDWARRAVQHNPNFLSGWLSFAASAAAIGRNAEAHMAAERVLALDPAFSIDRWVRRFPIGNRAKFEPIPDGLPRAGLPE